MTPIGTYSGSFLKYLRRLWPYVQNLRKTKIIINPNPKLFFVCQCRLLLILMAWNYFTFSGGVKYLRILWVSHPRIFVRSKNINGVIAYIINFKKNVVSRYYYHESVRWQPTKIRPSNTNDYTVCTKFTGVLTTSKGF